MTTKAIRFFTFFVILLSTIEMAFAQQSNTTSTTPEQKTAQTVDTADEQPGRQTLPVDDPVEKTASPTPTVDEILDKIEARYSGSGFSARFDQRSTIKAMDITDTAYGNVMIKRPEKMRWEYEAPERQIIITNGETLWVYRPDDKQVMVGKAPDYLGGGKGAGFLSNIRNIRKNFNVTLSETKAHGFYTLKLVPENKNYDVSAIYLKISEATADLVQIVTYNSYQDETRISLKDFKYQQTFDDDLFDFVPPEGTDVLRMDEQTME